MTASVLASATTASQASFSMLGTVLTWPVRSMGFVLRANDGSMALSFSTVGASNSAMVMSRSLLWSASKAPAPPDALSTETPPLRSWLSRGSRKKVKTSMASISSAMLSTSMMPACSKTAAYTA
ncbi:hypothetical protein D3C86_1594800 [compost metagenome]